jgi:hypothetical protein
MHGHLVRIKYLLKCPAATNVFSSNTKRETQSLRNAIVHLALAKPKLIVGVLCPRLQVSTRSRACSAFLSSVKNLHTNELPANVYHARYP